jgi:glutamine amidotransferase
MRVGVIDYGVGNLGSVMRALEELRVTPVLITRSIDMHTVDSLILPGVGNFAECARLLDERGWAQALRDEVQVAGKPLLGICLGMQLLATCSTEGASGNAPNGIPGLGLIPGRVEKLRTLGCSLRIPHVGWNEVTIHITTGGLFDGIPDGTDFYFVHSYALVPDNPSHVLATAVYDIPVTAAVRCGHIWGTQFHPEKSSRAGFRLLRNFIESPAC